MQSEKHSEKLCRFGALCSGSASLCRIHNALRWHTAVAVGDEGRAEGQSIGRRRRAPAHAGDSRVRGAEVSGALVQDRAVTQPFCHLHTRARPPRPGTA